MFDKFSKKDNAEKSDAQKNLNSVNEQSDDVLSDVSGGTGRRSKNRLLGKKKRKKGQK